MIAQARLHGLDDEANTSTAWAEFSIDRILQFGGRVQSCCIRSREENCLSTGASTWGPCWPTDAPEDAQGCCEEPCGRARSDGGGGGTGPPPDDGPTIFEPIPEWELGRDDDITWRDPDGGTPVPDDTPGLQR